MNGRHATPPVEGELQVPVTAGAPTPGGCIHTFTEEYIPGGVRWKCPQCGEVREWEL